MARSMKAKAIPPKEKNPDDDIPLTKDEAVKKRLQKIEEILMNPGEDSFAALTSTIHRAAATGRIDAVKIFITAKKIPPTQYDHSGVGPIHYAAEKGFINIVETLMEKGCEVDARTRSGVTALMYAAKGGQIQTMQWLWEHGAQVTAADVGGMTAAHYAAQSDCPDALELLMTLHMEDLVRKAGYIDSMAQAGQPIKVTEDTKADNIVLDTPSRNGSTPLHVAACFDAKNAVDVLLKYNVQINAQDSTGETPLHKAGKKNYVMLFNHLIAKGADERLKTITRETARDFLNDVTYT